MRIRRVLIHGQILVDIMTIGINKASETVKGLPEGTRFMYSIPDVHFGIWIVVEHPTFDLLKDGDEIPIHPDKPEIRLL